MLCFNYSCLITAKIMLPQQMHTENASSNFWKPYNFFSYLSTIWDNIYCLVDKYRYATVLYLLSRFEYAFHIIFDRSIGAPLEDGLQCNHLEIQLFISTFVYFVFYFIGFIRWIWFCSGIKIYTTYIVIGFTMHALFSCRDLLLLDFIALYQLH